MRVSLWTAYNKSRNWGVCRSRAFSLDELLKLILGWNACHISCNRIVSLECVLRWVVRRDFRANLSLHTWQQNVLSPACICRWVVNEDFWLNRMLHESQLNGFSPEWILCKWVIKKEFSLNRLPHMSQPNGFSSVCLLRKWTIQEDLTLNRLWHISQLNGFWLVCTFACFFNSDFILKCLPQVLQVCVLLVTCVCIARTWLLWAVASWLACRCLIL